MKKDKKIKQRLLQAFFGIGLIIFVLLIEFLAVHPSGIYSYVNQGYKEFKIGLSKEKVLKRINKRKSIRTIKVCNPDRIFELKSRKLFQLENELVSSDCWICPGRTGMDFLFLFEKGALKQVLLQRLRFGKKENSILFSRCNPELIKNIHDYLSRKETLKVFYDTTLKEKQ